MKARLIPCDASHLLTPTRRVGGCTLRANGRVHAEASANRLRFWIHARAGPSLASEVGGRTSASPRSRPEPELSVRTALAATERKQGPSTGEFCSDPSASKEPPSLLDQTRRAHACARAIQPTAAARRIEAQRVESLARARATHPSCFGRRT